MKKNLSIFTACFVFINIFCSFGSIRINSFATAEDFEYPTKIISADYYNQEIDYSLWDKFIRYDLCITDYDSLTDYEKELCRFIFETERSATGTVRCERARRILAGDKDIDERITLEKIDNTSGIYDKNNLYNIVSDDYYNYIHCVPDIKHLDETINVNEYWLDETGNQRILCSGYSGFKYYQNYGYCSFDESSQTWIFESIDQNHNINEDILLQYDNLIYTILPNNTISIIDIDLKDDTEIIQEPIIIPEEIDGLPVEEIGRGAFYTSPITQIELPNTLKRIRMQAFNCCTYLENINFPDSLEYIGEYAFRACKNLESVKMNCPNLVLSDFAFYGTGLKNIDINLKSINENSINSCELLETININGTDVIPADSFKECPNVKSVLLSPNISVIGEGAFLDKSIESAIIPSSIKIIGALPKAQGIIQYSSIADVPATDPLTEEPICAFDSDCIIYGYKDTEAERYADEWNLTFIALNSSGDVIGDANNDRKIDIADVVSISAFILNAEENPLSIECQTACDVHSTGNGLNADDALKIQQYIAGLIESL